ncbi:hypothetical protein E2562_001639 [Oryza meyeriana var. granulata]|uniref:Uncharacterized protein n=1 Tax=Oryza meyeriana var. granulata TaxID=110450 RepID=A0A6G1CCS0_9ORYZ|nr:hypothetical protein E2562_001639 [Oryza meyeriana var. granulata]
MGDGNAAVAVLTVAGEAANPRLSVPGLEPATSEPQSDKGDTSIHMVGVTCLDGIRSLDMIHRGTMDSHEENYVQDAADASPDQCVPEASDDYYVKANAGSLTKLCSMGHDAAQLGAVHHNALLLKADSSHGSLCESWVQLQLVQKERLACG